MPQQRTVAGAAGGVSLTLLADPVYQVSLAVVTGQWTPEADASLARLVAAVLMGILGILAMARDRITEAIEEAAVPEIDLGAAGSGVLAKLAQKAGFRKVRKTMPRVTPEDEPGEPGPIQPLPRSEAPRGEEPKA